MLRSRLCLLFLLWGFAMPLAAAERECRVKVVNLNPGFLHGVVVDLDADDVYGKLRAKEKSPLYAMVGGSLVVPVTLEENKVRLLLSLRPSEELDVVLKSTQSWGGPWYHAKFEDDGRRLKKLSNGLLTLEVDDDYNVTLISGGKKSRTMVAADSPVLLDDFNFALVMSAAGGDAYEIRPAREAITGASMLKNDRGIGLQVERRFDIKGTVVNAVEEFVLPFKEPVIEYALRLENMGAKDLYISKDAKFSAGCDALSGAVTFEGYPLDLDGNASISRVEAPERGLLKFLDGRGMVFGMVARKDALTLSELSAGRTGYSFARMGAPGGGKFIKLPAKRALVAGYSVKCLHPEEGQSGKKELVTRSPVAVYFGEKPISLPLISSFERSSFRVDIEGMRWQMGMDFAKKKILTVDVGGISSGARAAVFFRHLPSGSKMKVCQLTETGIHTVDLLSELKWDDVREFEVFVSIEETPSAYLDVNALSVAEPLPKPPEIISPANRFKMTDVAGQFSWRVADGGIAYDIQVARDPGFSRDVMQKRVVAEGEKVFCFMDGLRGHGSHYWRVRSVNSRDESGEWSDVYKVHVDDDYSLNEVRRKISSFEPMFIWDVGSLSIAPEKLVSVIPKKLRSSFVFSIGGGDKVLADELSALKKHNMPVFVSSKNSLSEIEMAFQDFSDVAGVVCHGQSAYYLDGEVSAFHEKGFEQLKRLVFLCAKYGKYFVHIEGNRNGLHWQRVSKSKEVSSLFRKYSNNIIAGHSFSLSGRSFASLDQTMGMMLDGMVSHMAVGGSARFWKEAGFGAINEISAPGTGDSSKMSPIVYCQQFIQGMSRGANVLVMTDCEELIRSKNDVMRVMVDHIIPFWKGIVENGMVPTASEVLGSARAVVIPDANLTKSIEAKPWGLYDALYSTAYGVSGKESILNEYIPNVSRYYFLPVLPYDTGGLPLDEFRRKVKVRYLNLSSMQKSDSVSRVLNEIYPVVNRSKAWVGLVGNKFYVMNTYENKSVSEKYSIDLREGFIKRIHGRVIPHMYLMGKLELTGFVQRQKIVAQSGAAWIQCDSEDTSKNIEIMFECNGVPEVEVTPRLAHLHKLWRMREKQLLVVLSARAGPVEIKIAPHSGKE